MKCWRGYLIAAIIAACTWALHGFFSAHSVLIDMIYPYVTRMAQSFLADWSSGVNFCVWQMLLVSTIALTVTSAVLMIILKWNPIRWGGWICTVVAVVVFLNTCLYGLNQYSGPLSEDVRLEETDYTITELEEAAVYYRNQANALANQVMRDSSENVLYGTFEELADQAVNGFETLVYEQSLSVFAGSMQPVKKLGWANRYTAKGVTGVTAGLTGEAAVNPETPPVLLPFAMCREMARRASIVVERDASFAAYLACMANEDIQFQYTGALLAYRYCLMALQELDLVTGAGVADRVAAEANANVTYDVAVCDGFYGDQQTADADACGLLVSWHIQNVVLPALLEEEKTFDPMDKTQVDLSDHPNA